MANRSEITRSFSMATWLGWQIESNWADPFLFLVYSIVRPLSGAAILVVMYAVITGANFTSPLFPYIYLGNAFYIYVGAIMSGISWTVIDDREHYKTLKYMYIAPLNIAMYLVGRGVAKFVIATLSVFITIAAGVLFLNVPLDLGEVNWLLFLVTLFLGIIMLATLGLMLAGVTLLRAHHVGFIGEAVAGALYLFSGAIFPLEVLPAWLRPVGFLMPITYWLELLRRSLVGDIAATFPTLANFTDLQLLGILAALTVAFAILSRYVFRLCDYHARERGMIDMTSNF